VARRTRSLREVVTLYRLGVTTVAAVAVLLLIYGFQGTRNTQNRSATCSAAPIVNLLPCPNDTGLRQGLIGAELVSGYNAALIVDTTEVPQDQLRTGGANQVFFQPGPGTETGALAPGVHSATLVYWPVNGTREHDAKSYVWSFVVS
jgi:hypothetical protein